MAWREAITGEERSVLEAAGFGHPAGLGERPALLVVDVTYGFVGREPLPILESIRTYPSSCGQVGWEAIEVIQELLASARRVGIPVAYSAGTGEPGRWAQKRPRHLQQPPDAYEIVDEIAPEAGELVIRKGRPSAFFASPLAEELRGLEVDGVIVAGATTSGCVRATVVDAFSHDLRVTVVEDAVFDRVPRSHDVALFDMAQKYADVRSSSEVTAELEGRTHVRGA